MHRQVRDRQDVRPVLEELAVAPQQAFELGDAEPVPQPAPQDEMLRACDDRGRIQLDHAQPMDGLDEGRRSGRGQKLARHRELARASSGEADGVRHAVKTTRRGRRPSSVFLPGCFFRQQPLHEPLVAQGAETFVETPPQPNEVDGSAVE